VNPAFARMISSQPDDLKGTEFIAVLPHEDREQWQKNIEKLQADSVNIEGEALLLSRNNDIVTVLNNTAIITGMDGLRQVVSFMLDITERKRAEVEIQKALEREKELSELKSRFVAMISHEFRTPLTIINSTTQLLERFQRNLNPDQQKEYLSRIQKAVQRMNNLISDVLFIGKAEANKVSFNPQLIDVVDVCGNIVKDVAFADNNKHDIRYTVHGEGYQRLMDEKLLQHIITNLLSNATKYSPEADKVDFDLVLEEHQAIFKVRDYGIGIPEEDQKHMFQDFHRASNVGTISGTGLGMAIVKNSAQLHGGGNVTFFSKVGEGTTFTVILPYAKNGV
jgi:PAS domain S-box-containing protein